MIRILISLLIVISTVTLADGYNRKEWKHWIDTDKDCENTREEALKRDAQQVTSTNDKCTPTSGVWIDPYTNTHFVNPRKLDADHIVPLKHAHTYGGSEWPKSRKRAFANDLENVLMVSAGANRSKGAKGPNKWMPPNEEFHCEYLEQWIYIKTKYALTISHAEHAFITNYREKNCN